MAQRKIEMRGSFLRLLFFGFLTQFICIAIAYAGDDLPLKPIQVAPHTYFVRGLP